MDKIEQLARKTVERLKAIGLQSPSALVVAAIFRIVQSASLTTEEGRFVQGSVTFDDPENWEMDSPSRLRADYPTFTYLKESLPFTPDAFAKLTRAVDKWSGSVAIWGKSPQSISIWGIVDQLVGSNVALNRESRSGFRNRGVFVVAIDRPGDFSIYHSGIFLGALRSQQLVLQEINALDSPLLIRKIAPRLAPTSKAICRALGDRGEERMVLSSLIYSWANTIARICIGLRRLGTGGSLLISPTHNMDALTIKHPLEYGRLRDSVALQVLDELYLGNLERKILQSDKEITGRDVYSLLLAQTDVEDREREVAGTVKLATSLAALDGAVLLTPELGVLGFGTKIGSAPEAKVVYQAESFIRYRTKSKTIDLSGFGTRHTSALRYCKSDPNAIAVIISQDGHVRIALTVNKSLIFWDRIMLLNQDNYSASIAKEEKRHIEGAREIRRAQGTVLGYSPMPKTMSDLLAGIANTKPKKLNS